MGYKVVQYYENFESGMFHIVSQCFETKRLIKVTTFNILMFGIYKADFREQSLIVSFLFIFFITLYLLIRILEPDLT